VPRKKKLLEVYAVGKALGEGAFGVVYSCTHRKTNEEVAVKMVDKVETPVEVIEREAAMLQALDHPNVVKMYEVFYEKCFVCIVMEQFSGGDLVEGLQRHWAERGKIKPSSVVHVAYQMAASIAYLHSELVIHRDVKGDNYLMDSPDITAPDCRIALSDFGTAMQTTPNQRMGEELGTKIFWPPEFFDHNYGLKVDIWAIGVIMYGMFDGRFPYKDENDIRNKKTKVPKKLGDQCEDFIRQCLEKVEAKRISAQDLVMHPWIGSQTVRASLSPRPVSPRPGSPRPQADEGGEEDDKEASPPTNLRAETVCEGVIDRRKELLERIENAHEKKERRDSFGAVGDVVQKKVSIVDYMASAFEISRKVEATRGSLEDTCPEGSERWKFEWWSGEKCEAAKIPTAASASKGHVSATERHQRCASASCHEVEKMLVEHGIDVKLFGRGEAKTLEQLASEVQSGSAKLMLDATEHKKLVRVVDIVLLRLRPSGDENRLLIETGEVYPDGRRSTRCQLPGTKKEPHENVVNVAERLVKGMLHMDDCEVTFDYENQDVWEAELESPSFPGVHTIYRKAVVEATITTTDPGVLARIGLPGFSAWSCDGVSQGGGTTRPKSWEWVMEKDCVDMGVQLKAPEGDDEVSGLVQAPIGLGEEELRAMLTSGGVDIEKFGHDGANTLKKFAAELRMGEATLTQESDGTILRVVDLVAVALLNPETRQILVSTEVIKSDGSKRELKRLPGAKRRPEENHFFTAKRLIHRQLKLDENDVNILPGEVAITEETKDSPAFPGVQTVYRKRIIRAELLIRNR